MKRIFYALKAIVAVIVVFSMSNCNNGSNKPPVSEDTTNNKRVNSTVDIKNIPFELGSDTQIYPKKLLFVDTSNKKFTPKDFKRYSELGYEIYDKKEFDTYYDYFQKLFKIANEGAIINEYMPFPYSIYEMYSLKLQHELGLQNETTIPVGMPGTVLKNFIRIYPAIDRATSELYLVFLGEYRKPGYKPYTLRSTYFTIKRQIFDRTSDVTRINAIDEDIRNFQAVWDRISDLSNPGYKFAHCESFVYSIEAYNELLSTPDPFWDLDNCKTDNTKINMNVMLIPIIDAKNTKHVSFRLVAIPHKKVGSSYIPLFDREFFDNMHVCPEKCPSNPIH